MHCLRWFALYNFIIAVNIRYLLSNIKRLLELPFPIACQSNAHTDCVWNSLCACAACVACVACAKSISIAHSSSRKPSHWTVSHASLWCIIYHKLIIHCKCEENRILCEDFNLSENFSQIQNGALSKYNMWLFSILEAT